MRSSVLRDFIETIDYNEGLESLKNKSLSYIKESNVPHSDKHRMTVQISLIRNKDKLIQYLFNALLKFEGHGVI